MLRAFPALLRHIFLFSETSKFTLMDAHSLRVSWIFNAKRTIIETLSFNAGCLSFLTLLFISAHGGTRTAFWCHIWLFSSWCDDFNSFICGWTHTHWGLTSLHRGPVLQRRAAGWMLETQVCAQCNKNILAHYVVMGVWRKKRFCFNNVRSVQTKMKICERDTEKLHT